MNLPQGYYVVYGGQFESESDATRTISFLGLFVIAGIFLLLFLAFRKVRTALLIMVNLPLALIGGVIAVYLGGGVLSVASLVGFITLFGITRSALVPRRARSSPAPAGLSGALGSAVGLPAMPRCEAGSPRQKRRGTPRPRARPALSFPSKTNIADNKSARAAVHRRIEQAVVATVDVVRSVGEVAAALL